MIERKYKNLRITAPLLFGVFFLALVFWPGGQAYAAYNIEPLYRVLQTNQNIESVWREVRNLVNILVMAILIGIAFANILRINLNNYAIKKFLPSLIMAVVLTNFSYFICRFMVDLANVMLGLLMNGASGGGASTQISSSGNAGIAQAFDFTSDIFKVKMDGLWMSLVYVLAEFVGGVMILIMAFLFYIRNYVIYFLVGISPLAFMAMIIPNTKSIFSGWWSMFMKWVFMPIVSVFWLWVGGVWYMSGFNPTATPAAVTSQGVFPGADFNSNLFALLFAGACYYLAITTPMKMGGSIMSGWQNLGKKVWDNTGAKAVKGGAWVATGGAASQYGAYAQAKAKLAGDVHGKDSDEYKKWDRRAKIASWVNPQSYKQGWNNRMAGYKANADKALLKGQAYGRVAGPETVIKGALEGNLEDYRGGPASMSAKRAAEFANHVATSTDANVSGFWQKQRREALAQLAVDPALQARVAQRGLSNEQYAKEVMLNKFRTMNGTERANLFHGADGMGGDPDLGEDLAAVTAYFQKGNNRDRFERDATFARVAASGATGTGNGGGVSNPQAVADAIDRDVQRRVELKNDRVGQTVAVHAEVLGELSKSDPNKSVEQRLEEVHSRARDGAALLAGQTSAEQINKAKQLALEISQNFQAALNVGPDKLKENLGHIFEDAGKVQSASIAEQLHDFQTNPNWRKAQYDSMTAGHGSESRREVLNERFAEGVSKISSEDMKALSDALGGHLDAIMQTNQEIAHMMSNNSNGQYNDVIAAARKEMVDATNKAIASQLGNVQSGATATPKQLEEAVRKAITSPEAAKVQGEVLNKALQNNPPKTVIQDVKPPAAPPTPPPAPAG